MVKLIIRNSILFFLLFLGIFIVGTQGDKVYAMIADFLEQDSGVLTVVSVDVQHGYPIKNSRFQIIDGETNEVIEEIETSIDGVATTGLLPLGHNYYVQQTNVLKPYQLNTERHELIFSIENNRITIENDVPSFIKEYKRTAEKDIVVTAVKLPVESILQTPELPNGCEVTALATVLNYYGYKTNKLELADKYMPKVAFTRSNNKLFGADPYQAYAGNPRSKGQGFFTYAQPIVKTAERYFAESEGKHSARNISGSSKKDIHNLLSEGIPVIIWTTVDMKEPRVNYSWHIRGTNEKIKVPTNSHTVVLTGFNDDSVFAMDPLKGHVTYQADHLFGIYEQAGGHAMVVY
ncbi:C39 family peptidase [Oceanobacillus chungangensis]|uniref:Peptidase C39-like domain-containing protein n=1 Tax=Oceanobacillus chungangensis TaxID=1229152 RepID=A0A3D8PHC2_9BACI|nr:C39 family peptidase [Oceanobacillus chungangensis]RDW15473.1 hypothetical protein CWR45_16960 [Oceanobacillus chungangensis]